jgi:hypothetical protein
MPRRIEIPGYMPAHRAQTTALVRVRLLQHELALISVAVMDGLSVIIISEIIVS